MSHVEESITVNVPVATAYNQWIRFEEFPNFMSGVDRIDHNSGDTSQWVARVAGQRRKFKARITDQVPQERVAWTTVEGEAHQTGEVVFRPLDDSHTEVLVRIDHDPQGLTDAVGDKLGLVERQTKSDLRDFKEQVESRGRTTGGWRGTS